VESFPQSIDIKFYHWVNNGGRYADGFYNSMIYGKDSHIPSALIMFTCTVLHHAFLEWKKNKGVYPKASKSRPKAGRPDRSNHFKYKIQCGINASCCAAMGCKLLTLLGNADTYRVLINTWNTLAESYQQRV
jgi:hypothetical protein